ncbi:MAG: DUF1566 domain-containing protein [Deltaproteobacteria bacterium]|nr:DUF1566 domain-containing protein [Deltaproteobacteria bacterium]
MNRMIRVCLLVFGFILNWSMVFAADVYVESSGSCGGKTPCFSTIQEAINGANSGDTIKSAQGIYAETFILNSGKQLILQGGWDAGFTKQTPRTTAVRAPIVTKGAMAFQELRIMEIAGPMGNATIDDVLEGKTFSSDTGTGLTGIMVNRGGMSYTPATTDQPIAKGYYNGSGKVEGDTDLVSANIRSGVSIFGVAGNSNVVDTSTGDAAAGDILSGKKAWVDGSEVTGNVGAGNNVSGADGSKTFTIPDGLYSGTKTATANDADLVTGNIRSTVTIFGVPGKTEVVDTTEGTNPVVAGRMKTGDVGFVNGNKITGTGTKTLSAASKTVEAGYYDATTLDAVDPNLAEGNIKNGVTIFGVEGERHGGCDCSGGTLNGTRWCDNGDGTVTDLTTCLVWLKNASWGGMYGIWVDTIEGTNADDRAAQLKNGVGGLTDGSVEGDWRLPTKTELSGLATGTEAVSSGSMRAFMGVQSYCYWSCTSTHKKYWSYWVGLAWCQHLGGGESGTLTIGHLLYVWPVRAGQ